MFTGERYGWDTQSFSLYNLRGPLLTALYIVNGSPCSYAVIGKIREVTELNFDCDGQEMRGKDSSDRGNFMYKVMET